MHGVAAAHPHRRAGARELLDLGELLPDHARDRAGAVAELQAQVLAAVAALAALDLADQQDLVDLRAVGELVQEHALKVDVAADGIGLGPYTSTDDERASIGVATAPVSSTAPGAAAGGPALPGGVLPAQRLREAIAREWLRADPWRIPPEAVQPASVDLRLGEHAWALRCSFLPDSDSTVEEKIEDLAFERIDLRDGATLERDRPYLVPLIEELALPAEIRAKANPKSSTGRLDVFTRVLTDRNHRFDEIAAGYQRQALPRGRPAHVRDPREDRARAQPGAADVRRRAPQRRAAARAARALAAAVPRLAAARARLSCRSPTACS